MPFMSSASSDPVDSDTLAFLGIGVARSSIEGNISRLDAVARSILALDDGMRIERFETFGFSGRGPLDTVLAGEPVRDLPCWVRVSFERSVPVIVSCRVDPEAAPDERVEWFLRRPDNESATRKEVEERLRTILNTTHEIVWTLDLEGRFTFVNLRGEEATGYRVPDWIGLPFDPLVHPDDREMVRECFRQTIAGNRSCFKTTVIDARGQTRALMVNTAPLVEGGRIVGMVGLGYDVTEKVRLEDELHKAQRIESLGLLAGGIAHDFNNILTAVLGGVTLARRKAGNDEQLAELLMLSEKACLRARDLTHQLMTFTRGGAPICRPADMAELIRETVRFVARGSQVRCDVQIEADLRLVSMDESQMSQVLGNVVLNGIQAMPSGGTLSIRARNVELVDVPQGSALQPGPHVCVEIADTGVGIPPEHAARVFDPYFSTKARGTGLGLATSYSIVRRHKGHLDFESTPGVGTTFRILLPATSQTTMPPSSRPKPGAPVRGRVLMVDDEPAVRELGALMLRGLGYQTDTVSSGEEAIERVRSAMERDEPFRAVLLDLTMPGGMSGRETARRLRQIAPDVALIASSGYSTDPIMSNHAAYGFDAAVPKPYIAAELDAGLRKALGHRER